MLFKLNKKLDLLQYLETIFWKGINLNFDCKNSLWWLETKKL